LASATLSVAASCVGAVFSASVGSLAKTSWSGVMGLVLAFAFLSLFSMTCYYYFELVDKRKGFARLKALDVMKNVGELVLHMPHYELQANGPAGADVDNAEASSDPTMNKKVMDSFETHVETSHKSLREQEHRLNEEASGLSFEQRWQKLRDEFGPSSRMDANTKVRKEIACLFFLFFVVFAIATFISYFIARTNPGFVFAFGDVQFANKTVN
jgi:hypothetical protein